MAKSQRELYERFLDLHKQPGIFVMPNAWDGLSALLLKDAGFQALGTSSAALAFALGRLDGRHAVSRDEHLANATLLNTVSNLPINGDFEDGYGDTPDDVAATVEAAITAGLAGIGIEDTTGNGDKPLRDFDDAVARVAAAAKVAKGTHRPHRPHRQLYPRQPGSRRIRSSGSPHLLKPAPTFSMRLTPTTCPMSLRS